MSTLVWRNLCLHALHLIFLIPFDRWRPTGYFCSWLIVKGLSTWVSINLHSRVATLTAGLYRNLSTLISLPQWISPLCIYILCKEFLFFLALLSQPLLLCHSVWVGKTASKIKNVHFLKNRHFSYICTFSDRKRRAAFLFFAGFKRMLKLMRSTKARNYWCQFMWHCYFGKTSFTIMV